MLILNHNEERLLPPLQQGRYRSKHVSGRVYEAGIPKTGTAEYQLLYFMLRSNEMHTQFDGITAEYVYDMYVSELKEYVKHMKHSMSYPVDEHMNASDAYSYTLRRFEAEMRGVSDVNALRSIYKAIALEQNDCDTESERRNIGIYKDTVMKFGRSLKKLLTELY